MFRPTIRNLREITVRSLELALFGLYTAITITTRDGGTWSHLHSGSGVGFQLSHDVVRTMDLYDVSSEMHPESMKNSSNFVIMTLSF